MWTAWGMCGGCSLEHSICLKWSQKGLWRYIRKIMDWGFGFQRISRWWCQSDIFSGRGMGIVSRYVSWHMTQILNMPQRIVWTSTKKSRLNQSTYISIFALTFWLKTLSCSQPEPPRRVLSSRLNPRGGRKPWKGTTVCVEYPSRSRGILMLLLHSARLSMSSTLSN